VNDITEANTQETVKKYDEQNMFEKQGFKAALEKFDHRKLHIDIGSGTGWLLGKTAPLFEKVIGIEPSKAATHASGLVFSNFKNIEYINEDVVDAMKSMDISSPAFFTSSIVFSHIKNFHVANFLKELNMAPQGSTFHFFENYDTNIQHAFWYIRNKEWWAKRLPNWQLTFMDIPNEEYKSGIFGICVGKENVTDTYSLPLGDKIRWRVSGVVNLARKAIRKIKV
jgi:SAM-dependent methyltransferase